MLRRRLGLTYLDCAGTVLSSISRLTDSGVKRIARPMRTNSISRRHTFIRTVAGDQPVAKANCSTFNSLDSWIAFFIFRIS
jgi:hypothetical protein